VDYQKSNPGETDWTASGNAQLKNGQTAESKRGTRGILSPAGIDEYPAFLRWEDPVLGINGEGHISPLMPGCQVIYTVIGQDGKRLAQSRIENNETEAEVIGQDPIPLSIDMAPVNPHTNQKKARSCESCHTDQKTAGLGMGNTGSYFQGIDLSQVISENGIQLATVGTHWPLSRALNKIELNGFLRIGTCMGCHRNMDNSALWKKVSSKGTLDSSRHIELMTQALKNMK